MREGFQSDIDVLLNSMSTEELLQLWQDHDTDEWQEIVFEIIGEILTLRLGSLPPLPPEARYKRLVKQISTSIKEQDFGTALKKCLEALEADADAFEVNYYMGIILDELGQRKKADGYYQKAFLANPYHRKAWTRYKKIEAQQKDTFYKSRAKTHLDKALEYAYAGDFDSALEKCEKARETLPNVAIAYNYLGLTLQTMQKIEAAIEAYAAATRINPRFTPAWENLSFAKRQLEESYYFLAAQRTPEENQELAEMKFDLGEKKLSKAHWGNDILPGWYYMDAYAYLVPGTPGYRTRPGRSGYDQLDSKFEEARMEGIIIKRLFTGKLRTKDPINRFVMLCFSSILGLFIAGVVIPMGNPLLKIALLVFFSPFWVIGTAFLINLILSFATDNKKGDGRMFY